LNRTYPIVLLQGPSGCGTTTLLRLVAGFLAPDGGGVRLRAAAVTRVPARERACGLVFQNNALFPTMRVWENVAYPQRICGVDDAARRARGRIAQHALRASSG